MVIVRSCSRTNKADTQSTSSTDDRLLMTQKQASVGRTDSEASLDSEVSGRNVEICQVEEEMCAVPFELFGLSDLKEVLSLDTWNFYLTEDERESLCAYLPDLDETAYRQTLKDLFSGQDFHFGSPLTELFHRLKGGLCHPHVARYKEGLKYLQRKQHYQALRKYHNNMVTNFREMQILWQSHPHAGVEERIELWDSWKSQNTKPLPRQPLEKKLLSLKSRRSAGRSAKTVKMLKAKEVLKASHPHLCEAEMADTNISGALKMKSVSKFEVVVKDTAADISVKEFEKDNNKLLFNRGLNSERKSVLKRNRTHQVEASETVPGFDETSEAIPRGNDCRADNSFPMDHKFSPNEAVEYDVSVSGMPVKCVKMGRTSRSRGKRKHLKEFPESEAVKIELEPTMEQMEDISVQVEIREIKKQKPEEQLPKEENYRDEEPRKTYRRRAKFKEKRINEDGELAMEEKHMQGMHVESEMHFASEEKSDQPACLEESKKDVEPRKKYKRRTTAREKSIYEEGQAVVSIKAELDESALVFEEENLNHLSPEDKIEEPHGKLPKKRFKKKLKGEENGPPSSYADTSSVSEKTTSGKALKKAMSLSTPAVALSLPFSVIHLLSAVRTAMVVTIVEQTTDPNNLTDIGVSETLSHDCTCIMSPDVHYSEPNVHLLPCDDVGDMKNSKEERRTGLSGVPFPEIVRRVQANPGDPRILEMPERIQGLVRGVLRVLSSRTSPPGIKGWKPFVAYDKDARVWSWIGPLPPLLCIDYVKEVDISAEAWGVSEKTLIKSQELFANWLKHAQESLQQLGQLSLPPPPLMLVPLNEKERFRELKAQKSLTTINPSSDEMRAYFRKEEVIRYSVPDMVFTYTTADGQKSVVAPLKRIGGKPNSKARDHFILKPDRPSHVTILCLVRDAAARLPGAIGTRADVCALMRDSQYMVEDVSETQLNQVVSGALDRLHCEKDPCIRFDGDRKLWVYLHTQRDEEDFEDDGTSSVKRWKRPKKECVENSDLLLVQDYAYSGKDNQGLCNIGVDFSSPSCFGEPSDFSVYPTGRPELVYNHQVSTLGSPRVLGSGFPGQVRDDGVLPFIDLPPSIQPPCMNMQQSHPMGWEVLGSHWDQGAHFHPHNHLLQEDFGTVAVMPLYAVKPGQ